MARVGWGVVSGFIVLAFGVGAILFINSTTPPADVQTEQVVAAPTTAPAAASDTSIPTTVGIQGVPDAVARVLEMSGDARLASDSELSQLPPSVAAVLVSYGVTLRVPLDGSGG